jgi:hypothetical protein
VHRNTVVDRRATTRSEEMAGRDADAQVSHRAILGWIGLGAIGWGFVGGVVALLMSFDVV